MKNILIISYLFAPENAIGAIRPLKIAKYLKKNKYNVDVVTTSLKNEKDEKLKEDIKPIDRITELNHTTPFLNFYNRLMNKLNKKNLSIQKGNSKSIENKLKKSYSIRKTISFNIRYSISLYKSYDFFKVFKENVKSNPQTYKKYEVCISTFGPTASLLSGLWLKRKFPNIKWICDFRDPMVLEDTPFLFKNYNRYLQKKACKNADYIVAVSEGYLDRICKNKYHDKSYVIPNGYDIEDLDEIGSQDKPQKFSLVYPGALYGGKRKITPLFRVLSELAKEKKIDLYDIEFWYAGSQFNILFEQAQAYSIEDILVNHGTLSRKDCLELQCKSRYLILSTWNNNGEEGVFPGKILEYMLFNKPIIALVSGNKANSEIYQMIHNSKIGIAYEEMQAEHYILLKEYILNEYKRFKKGLEPTFNSDEAFVNKYNYLNIIKDFIFLIERSS
ncbi:glycosyltransferase [Neobacillus notoginsengisoli]|uniref:glycosyltransferase n=1 Tax=Neobacillus notoginsengisoli TaxID=1578198 RepID=UPI001314FA8C|nr:glycosyltransferase [Neobacillus notoginsengisoli]